MNTYRCENGDRVSQATIERNIRKAKEIKKASFLKEHGYIFCEASGAVGGIIDISHIISVKYAKETGRTNLCWDQRNLRFLIRKLHEKHDNLTNQEREKIFEEWNEPKMF